MTNPDSILKSRDINLLSKVCLDTAMVFSVVMYGCESWTIKKAKHWRIDAFELWCWRRLEIPLDCKEIQPVHPKGNYSWIFIGRTDAEAETLILWPPDEKNAGNDCMWEEKGSTEDWIKMWDIYIYNIYIYTYIHSSIQSLSRVWLFATPRTAARQASLSIANSRSSLKLKSIKSVMPSSHLILCHPLLLLPPILPSIRVSSNESTLCMRWPKYWSFSFSIIPSKEHPGRISFRMEWLDLLAV